MTGVILEIASGSGEHVVHFARNLPSLVFQPSDPEPKALLSVAAWVKDAQVTNVRRPIVLDASQSPWPIASADGIICINMVHISPWDATIGLITGAAATRLRHGLIVASLSQPRDLSGRLAPIKGNLCNESAWVSGAKAKLNVRGR